MRKLFLLCPSLLAVSCATAQQGTIEHALSSIKPDSLLNEIKQLASDDFQGRKPGTPGEEKTVAYLQAQFQEMALKPGNPDGTFVQKVPLAGTSSTTQADFTV